MTTALATLTLEHERRYQQLRTGQIGTKTFNVGSTTVVCTVTDGALTHGHLYLRGRSDRYRESLGYLSGTDLGQQYSWKVLQ
ncbi:MAG: hypothetical protein MZV63_56170 [Marinilabiliales bacterium]|nr:hypothetical protein [Marinilabiliales bacterium]